MIKNNFYKSLRFCLLLAVTLVFLNPLLLRAQTGGSYDFNEQSGLKATANNAGYDINSTTTAESIVSQVIAFVLAFLGVIFLALMIYGGILWMTAAGNEERVKKARKIMFNGLIGLVAVIAAYLIAYFVINFFGKQSLI